MGLFDTLIDYDIECPYCHEIGGYEYKINIQTKQLSQSLNRFYIHKRGNMTNLKNKSKCMVCSGWSIDKEKHTNIPELRELNAIAVCNSPYCKYISNIFSIVNYGKTGNGTFWNIKYRVDKKGRAYSPAIITEKKDYGNISKLEIKALDKLLSDKNMNTVFQKQLKKTPNQTIAIIMMYL